MPLSLIPEIHRATHRIGLYLADLREQGVTQGEAHILAHLADANPTTVGELHKSLAHRRSTLTSILDRLVERGLVTRETGVKDRRTFVIALTTKGRQTATAVHRHLSVLERDLKRAFPTDALAGAAAVLTGIANAAERRMRNKE